MIGETISHYKITGELGRGGMGVVYKAEDLKLQRTVALKFLAPHIVTDEEHRKRMLYEARATAALDHPNISTIHEIEEVDGHVFIVMAYIKGESLTERIRSGAMEISEVLDIGVQTGRGLSKAHAAGIVHRDIKPGNILITPEGQVKIVDFGLAKLASQTRLTQAGTILGTTAYMSPEQVSGADADASSDIWALGVVLYEMLTGAPPFQGEIDAAILYSVMNEDPKPLTEIRKDLPVELEKILEKALFKDKDRRFQSMDEFLASLEELKDRLALGIKQNKFAALKRTKIKRRIWASFAAIFIIASAALIIRQIGYGPSEIDSMAVLPFMNLSGDPAQEYFSDGMTDELITKLGQISALRITSRTSVMQFKDTDKSIPQIADELNVDAIIESSVIRTDDRIKIAIKLIRANPEENLWSKEYENDLGDIKTVYSEIAEAIAEQINVALTLDEREKVTRKRKVDPEAYDLYLKGIHFASMFEISDMQKGIRYLRDAVNLDPTFSDAFAELGGAYAMMGFIGALPVDEAGTLAKAAVDKALQLDQNHASANGTLGFIRLNYDWDIEGAGKAFEASQRENPEADKGGYSFYLTVTRQHDKAVEVQKGVVERDPLSLFTRIDYGWKLYYAGRYDEAIEIHRKVIEEDPDSYWAYMELGWSYTKKELYPEAEAALDSAISVMDRVGGQDYTVLYGECGYFYGKIGKQDKAQEMFDRLFELNTEHPVDAFYIARIMSGMGRVDEMYEWLEKGYRDRSPSMMFLAVDFSEHSQDPRFIALAEKVGIPPGLISKAQFETQPY